MEYNSLVLIITCIGFGIIWGAIAQSIGRSKNIKGGFAIGFLLGIIGVIIVACMSDQSSKNTQSFIEKSNEVRTNKYNQLEKLAELKSSGVLTEDEYDKEKTKILE